ncbi:MAG TPA: glycoside hydrolase family 3 N-terminal domain-containing protein [Gemmatimonadales bacterium]
MIGTLSVREKVGQLVMPWLTGSYAALESNAFDSLTTWVDSFQVGGIVVSVGSPMDVAAKLNALQRRSRLPLLIAADLENGPGMRLVGGTSFPAVMAIGATGNPLDAYEMGRVTAIEARAVGIQLAFSPVADVNNNPANPIINTRSFGEDPVVDATMVSAFIHGAGEHGLFTTAKHFPGHGDTGADSHIDVPVQPACWSRLDTLELIPFRATIAAGVAAVMTAHVALPCVNGGSSVPATLSAAVMTGMLRDSLGFKGLVVTDALDMGAIIRRYGSGESAVMAFLAGSDLLLMPKDIRAALDAMEVAVNSGRITRERLDASVRRILDLKARSGLFRSRTVPLDSIPAVVGRKEAQNLADDIAQRALTLVQAGPVNTMRATRGRTAVITYAEETSPYFGGTLLEWLAAGGDTVVTFRLYPSSGPMSYDSARIVMNRAPRVLFASSVRPIAGRGTIALPDSLAVLILGTSQRKPTMLASFGSPYLLNQLPDYTGGYLLAWSSAGACERAVAKALTSGVPIQGHLPIRLSPTLPRGFGLMVPAP